MGVENRQELYDRVNNRASFRFKGYVVIPPTQIQLWVNAIGLIMAAMPDPYWTVLHERILELITSPEMTEWTYGHTPFQLFNLNTTNDAMLENKYSLTLALAHSVWYHAGAGQIMQVPQ